MSHSSSAIIDNAGALIRKVGSAAVGQKTTGGSTLTVPYPSGLVVGNMLVLCLIRHNTGGSIPSMPGGSGFTAGGVGSTSSVSGGSGMRAGTRVIDGSEGASVAFSTFGTDAGTGVMVQLENASGQGAAFAGNGGAANVNSVTMNAAANSTRAGQAHIVWTTTGDTAGGGDIPTVPVTFEELYDGFGLSSGGGVQAMMGLTNAPGFFNFTVTRSGGAAARMCSVCLPINPII